MSNSITEVLPILRENLKVSENEAKILLPIYLGGNMTAGSLSLYSEIKLSTVERVLKTLEKKGLVFKIEGIVDVYRATDPTMSITTNLSKLLVELEEIGTSTTSSITAQNEDIDTSVVKTVDDIKRIAELTKSNLDEYETQMMDAVQSQVESIANVSTQILSSFTENFETTLSQVDTTLEENLGSKLLELQEELDKSQKALQKDITSIKTELNKWLKEQETQSIANMKSFDNSGFVLLDEVLDNVTGSVSESNDTISKISTELNTELSTKIDEISNDAVSSFGEVSVALSEAISDFESRINEAHAEALETLTSLMNDGKSLATEEGVFIRDIITQASETIIGTAENIESWKVEVSNFIDNTSRIITTQLEQISSTDSAYLDAIKTSVTGYLERVTNTLTSEYTALRNLSSSIVTDFEEYLGSTRNSVMNLFNRQMKADQTALVTAGESLHAEIDTWSTSTMNELQSRLKGFSTSLDSVLNTESTEFTKLAENMNSRLKSSFNTALSSAKSRN